MPRLTRSLVPMRLRLLAKFDANDVCEAMAALITLCSLDAVLYNL